MPQAHALSLDHAGWGNIFQSPAAFVGLIRAICVKDGLLMDLDALEPLTPGTNAVFRAGATVVKIFAPPSTGLNPPDAFAIEQAALVHAMEVRVRTPKLRAAGSIEANGTFDYIVMDFAQGREAKELVRGYVGNTKSLFVAMLNRDLVRLHVPPVDFPPQELPATKTLGNARWRIFSSSFRAALPEAVGALKVLPHHFVHGDLTGDNILITPSGLPLIIDYGDSTLAPYLYEYPPIVFDLFACDRELLQAFIGKKTKAEFLDELYHGLLIHPFGPHFIRDFITGRAGLSLEDIDTPLRVRDLLAAHLL